MATKSISRTGFVESFEDRDAIVSRLLGVFGYDDIEAAINQAFEDVFEESGEKVKLTILIEQVKAKS